MEEMEKVRLFTLSLGEPPALPPLTRPFLPRMCLWVLRSSDKHFGLCL